MLRPEIGIHMRPVPHSKNRLKAITIDDVRTYLEKYGLQQKDLMKLLDIDKTSINCSLNEDLKLTRYQKVMFLLFI